MFHLCGYGKWVSESSGRRGGALNNGILHPRHKAAVESDAYGGPKCGSNICRNDDEATDGMGHTSEIMWFENFASAIIVDGVTLYGSTSEQLVDYFRTVLDVLKHHHATLKLKSKNDFRTGASL